MINVTLNCTNLKATENDFEAFLIRYLVILLSLLNERSTKQDQRQYQKQKVVDTFKMMMPINYYF